MSSQDTPTGDRLENIVLRDLQSLLRKSIGEEVVVLDYKTTSLLPAGENYGSSMLKVDAVIRKSKESPEEELHVVAKMLPPSQMQRAYFNATASFNKEIFVFQRLIDAYRKIEGELGVKPENSFDILPKFYGGRLSMKENNSEADDDVVMLMENLKTSGYYCMDRLKGLDLEHARLAITELARFHALGMALKYKRPDFFKEAKEILNVYPFATEGPGFDEMIQSTIDMICNDARIAKYEDRVRERTKIKFDFLKHYEVTGPWESIIHGDFWVNNIMFHKENDKIDGIKFVDFQISQVSSPLKDLPYFLCASLRMEVIEHHFKDLLDTYHANFIKVLEKTGCDTSPFTEDSFYEQLKEDAKNELFHCLLALKVFTLEPTADFDLNKMETQVFHAKGSSIFFDRCWSVVSKFVEMEWM